MSAQPTQQRTRNSACLVPAYIRRPWFLGLNHGSRARCIALACCALAVLIAVPQARAQDAVDSPTPQVRPRVRIQRSLRGDPLIDESIVRTLGELGAVDLDVEVLHRASDVGDEVGPLESNTYGLLTFDRQGDVIRVRAWGPDGAKPMEQVIDTRDQRVTAEVIAVRAVEALRAKWLQYGELTGAALPESILEFARAQGRSPREPAPKPPSQAATELTNEPPVKPQPPPTAPSPPSPPRTTIPPPPPPAPPPTASSAIVLQLLGGPSLTLEAPSTTHYGLDGSLMVGTRGVYLGGSISGSLTRLELKSTVGSANVARGRYLGVLRGELDLSAVSRGFIQLGVGISRYSIDANPIDDEQLEALDSVQSKPCGAMRLGFSVWPHTAIGIYLDGEVSILSKALVLRMDGQPIETLGSPAAALGMGVMVRYPIIE